MSSWRDRNERDAKPQYIDINTKHDVQEDKYTARPSKAIFSTLLSFLAGIISILAFTYAIGSNNHVRTSVGLGINTDKFICKENNSGNLETLLVRNNGDRQLFIKWSANYSNSSYKARQRCSQISDRLNKYTNTKKAKYIVYRKNEDSVKICVVENLEKNCIQDNTILQVSFVEPNSKNTDNDFNQLISHEFIDYINVDNCHAYLDFRTKESYQKSEKLLVCAAPWIE
jgi:hypothetical protein